MLVFYQNKPFTACFLEKNPEPRENSGQRCAQSAMESFQRAGPLNPQAPGRRKENEASGRNNR
jgi:hypothetical protein